MQIPHSLIKDLEDVSRGIASNTGVLARGKLSPGATIFLLDEMQRQSQQFTEVLENVKKALQDDDSWQRGKQQ